MPAVQSGLANRLQEEYPHIIIAHDFSHIFNIAAEKAVAKLPSYLVSLIKSVSNYFSSKNVLRNMRFREIQYQKLITIFSTFARIVVSNIKETNLNLPKKFNQYYKLPWSNQAKIKKLTLDTRRYLDWQFIDEYDYFNKFSEANKGEILEGIKTIYYHFISRKRLVPYQYPVLRESSILNEMRTKHEINQQLKK